MPFPSSLDLLYACITDSNPDRFPKRISPEENLRKMVDLIVGNADDIVGQCGHSAEDDDDCWFLDEEDDDEYYDW